MSLPEKWIDAIFTKLGLIYGQDFTNRWKGTPLDEVKADWGKELAGFAQRPEAIKHALEHLPAGKPPTVLEFREIARKVPSTAQHLPSPPASPSVLQAELKRLVGLRRPVDKDPKEWARKLIAKSESGQWVRPICLRFAREALRRELASEAE